MTSQPIEITAAQSTAAQSTAAQSAAEPSAAEPSAAEQCAAELMETIYPIMQFIRTEMRSQRESSLSVPQFRVMVFLSRHAGASLSEVAEHLGVTRATASVMVDRLVQHGLLDRTDDPQERRQIRLSLTQIGGDRLSEMREVTRQKIATLLKRLTAEELENVAAGLTALRRVFQ
jgi:DNA-binding MarR family transcriptional regulator